MKKAGNDDKLTRRAERRKLWMLFLRSRSAGEGVRASRTQKIPTELLTAMANPKQRGVVFNIWVASGCDWGRAAAVIKKYHKSWTIARGVERWMTLSQLEKHYNDKTMAKNVSKSAPSRPHKNLLKTDAAAADKNPEFQVEIFDDKEMSEEWGVEAAMIVEGELGKKDDGIAQLLSSLDPKAWDGKKGDEKPVLSEAEKAEKKRKLEEKKAEREAKLESDPQLRAKEWLRGISKDITKLKTAYNEVLDVGDEGVKQLYKMKFKQHINGLQKVRVAIENAVGKGSAVCKTTLAGAEGSVQVARDDLAAWAKVKTVYITDE